MYYRRRYGRGLDVRLSADAEHRRQIDQQHADQHRVWQQAFETIGPGVLVFVGHGSRWYTYDADAELMSELGLCRLECFRLDTVDVPLADLPIGEAPERTPAWVTKLHGYKVMFVFLRHDSAHEVVADQERRVI